MNLCSGTGELADASFALENRAHFCDNRRSRMNKHTREQECRTSSIPAIHIYLDVSCKRLRADSDCREDVTNDRTRYRYRYYCIGTLA